MQTVIKRLNTKELKVVYKNKVTHSVKFGSIKELLHCPIVSCFVLFGCYLLEAVLFQRRKGGRVDMEESGDGGVAGVDGGENVVAMCCMREESVSAPPKRRKKVKEINLVIFNDVTIASNSVT